MGRTCGGPNGVELTPMGVILHVSQVGLGPVMGVGMYGKVYAGVVKLDFQAGGKTGSKAVPCAVKVRHMPRARAHAHATRHATDTTGCEV